MPAVLILSRADVEAALDLDALREAMAGALTDLSAGRASMPPRVAASVDAGALLAVMPGFLQTSRTLAAKLVSVFPENDARGIPSHQAIVAVFDAETGTPVAVMDGTHITATRTAAASALATQLLAREDAAVLAIIGTGVQANAHADAIPRVRRIREVRVAGRDVERSRAFARGAAERLGLDVRAVETYAEAMDGADVVCATTHAVEPVVRREWLRGGVHVNSVGFNPDGAEVDAATVADALLAVESRASSLAAPPAGAPDLVGPLRDGSLKPEDVVELGELVAGTRGGRTSAEQITLYRSVGVAVEDAAAAALVVRAASATGAGARVEL